jgi:hypothetical protein
MGGSSNRLARDDLEVARQLSRGPSGVAISHSAGEYKARMAASQPSAFFPPDATSCPCPEDAKARHSLGGGETLYLLGGAVSRHLSHCLYGLGDLFLGTENAKGKTHCPSGEGANGFVS